MVLIKGASGTLKREVQQGAHAGAFSLSAYTNYKKRQTFSTLGFILWRRANLIYLESNEAIESFYIESFYVFTTLLIK
ncbi:hypothetical protein HanIR_Chr08g0342501 [Helianthus annuus]|nr:hypothetical protein HanIR_Chr08g0342501 [Helianthus annuus]